MGRRVEIQVIHQKVGNDWLFTVTGGVAHIGAIAAAGKGKTGFVKELIELPGHKEGLLAEQLAERAAKRLDAMVTVVVGIHIPDASRSEIEQAVTDAVDAFNKAIEGL